MYVVGGGGIITIRPRARREGWKGGLGWGLLLRKMYVCHVCTHSYGQIGGQQACSCSKRRRFKSRHSHGFIPSFLVMITVLVTSYASLNEDPTARMLVYNGESQPVAI